MTAAQTPQGSAEHGRKVYLDYLASIKPGPAAKDIPLLRE